MVDTVRGRDSRRALVRGALAGLWVAAVGAVATSGAAAHLARRIVSVDAEHPDDVEILEVTADTVLLAATQDTLAPGRYGVWFDGGQGHARLGDVVARDLRGGTVTRTLLGVDRGELRPGGARWNRYFYCGTPGSALSLDFEDVQVVTECGSMPAWVVPPRPGAPLSGTWVVLVHGRGATREECLRALPVLQRLGVTSLIVSYRNDPGMPASPGGRYQFGDAEWADVEAAVAHAAHAGAREVVLLGWSMGGAMALQVLTRSWIAGRVNAVVLDGPVLDWRHVLSHHARIRRVPSGLVRLAGGLLGHPWARRLVGVDAPVSFDRMDWVRRAADLQVPVLILHSLDDEFVPCEPSRRLAGTRPDLVTLVPFTDAPHTAEWNVDPDLWEAAVARFLLRL